MAVAFTEMVEPAVAVAGTGMSNVTTALLSGGVTCRASVNVTAPVADRLIRVTPVWSVALATTRTGRPAMAVGTPVSGASVMTGD